MTDSARITAGWEYVWWKYILLPVAMAFFGVMCIVFAAESFEDPGHLLGLAVCLVPLVLCVGLFRASTAIEVDEEGVRAWGRTVPWPGVARAWFPLMSPRLAILVLNSGAVRRVAITVVARADVRALKMFVHQMRDG